MRACWRKSSKALAQNTGFLDGGYYVGGVNNRQSPSAVFRFALFRGESLSNHAAEGDGAAAAVAGRHIRIRVGIVRTRVDARDVQAFNCLAIVVDSLEVFVNRNAVERAQHVARSANAIERRRANCRQTMRVFSEIGVDARVVILILALDGLLQRFGRQAKAFRKLINGIGHHDIAILDQAFVDALGSFERHIGRCVVVEGENARTAMDVELLEVLLVVGVPNVYHGVAGLGQGRIQNVVVQHRLVGEALAVQVDLFRFPPYKLCMAFPLAGGHRVCGARHSFAAGFCYGSSLRRFSNRRFRLLSLWAASVSIREYRGGFYSAHRNEKRKREVDDRFCFAKSQKIGKREIDRGL